MPAGDCCGLHAPIGAMLRRRVVRQGGTDLSIGAQPSWTHSLCVACAEWLNGLLVQVRRESDSKVQGSRLGVSPECAGRSVVAH